MSVLTLNDRLYSALETEALRTGRPVVDLVTEAVETWLADSGVDDAKPAMSQVAEQDQQHCRRLFDRLSEQWRQERPRGVDVAEIVMHPSYQRIIGMGETAIPMILNELDRRPDHWFWALHAITGADPVSESTRGILSEMSKAWLEWGRESGYR